jgi:hypothetical protein
MSLTVDQLLQCEDRLRAEIAERECLLAAVGVLKGYAEKGTSLKTIELGALGRALVGESAPHVLLLPETSPEKAGGATPTPVAPALPRPKPYIHPELAPFEQFHGGTTEAVWWAIQRMTHDYSVRDIHALLKREGFPIDGAQTSVVLTRMRRQGKIVEVKASYGPRGAIYRKPEHPIVLSEASVEATEPAAAA